MVDRIEWLLRRKDILKACHVIKEARLDLSSPSLLKMWPPPCLKTKKKKVLRCLSASGKAILKGKEFYLIYAQSGLYSIILDDPRHCFHDTPMMGTSHDVDRITGSLAHTTN